MPLHLGKIAALIALLTIGAFVLWLVFGAFWQGEQEAQKASALTGSNPHLAASSAILPATSQG
jgi:hypothetical protein